MEEFKEPGFIGAANDAEVADLGMIDQALTRSQLNVREVVIRVPADVPDHAVHTAFQIGMSTLQRVQLGLMVIAYPSIAKGKDGQAVNMIGRAEVLLAKQEDVQRIIDLGTIITNINKELADTSKQNPADLLAASIRAKQLKDEAARHAAAEAQGQSPIILATSLPKKGMIK